MTTTELAPADVVVCPGCITDERIAELAGRLEELDTGDLIAVLFSSLDAAEAIARGPRRCIPGCPTTAARERRRYAANPAAAIARAHARRARLAGVAGHATAEQITARIAYYGARCYLCRAEASTIDHVIPLARGGSNWPANIRPACRSCNARKGRRLLAELSHTLRQPAKVPA